MANGRVSPPHPTDEIVDRLRAKQEEELEELKKRSAEEAQKARLEQEKEDVDVEESEEQAMGEGPQEAEVKGQQQQEAQEEKEVTPENEAPATGNELWFYLKRVAKCCLCLLKHSVALTMTVYYEPTPYYDQNSSALLISLLLWLLNLWKDLKSAA